jgi:hypothetical protein
MPVTSYSRTPANNNSAAPNGAPEGWAPSAVNDTVRQIMADVANECSKGATRVLASVAGTNTITGSLNPDLDAYSAGMTVILTPANNNTGATTLNIDSLGALDVLKQDGDALVSGDLVAGVPALLLLDSGADDWILLNPQTFADITVSGSVTTDNTTADEVGFKGIPQNAQSGNYTLVLTDAGKSIVHASGAGAGDTYTIPANSSVAFPVGTAVVFVNAAADSITIAITTDTLTLGGTTSTGSRTLAQNGVATAIKVSSTAWIISGVGLS